MRRDEEGLKVLQEGKAMDIRPLRLRHETGSSGNVGKDCDVRQVGPHTPTLNALVEVFPWVVL